MVLATTPSLFAATFTVGGLEYSSITEPSGSEPGTCKVANQHNDIYGAVIIPDQVAWSGKTYDVVEIASGAFEDYGYYDIEITEVTIGDNVKKIGGAAFQDQYSLTKVTFGANVEEMGGNVFSNCDLRSVVIPSKVKTIGRETFYNNMSLKSVTLPEGLTTIEAFAFYACRNLTNITIPSTVTNIAFESNAFGQCSNLEAMNVAAGNNTYKSVDGIVYSADGTAMIFCPMKLGTANLTFPSTLTTIGPSAFKGITTIQSVTFPSSLTSIGEKAFEGCTSLRSISIPASVRTIGDYAFADCTSSASLTLAEGVTTMGISAFKNNKAISEVTIPASVTDLKWSTFTGCTGLREFKVAAGNPRFSAYAGALLDNQTHTLLNYPGANRATSFTAPDGCLTIEAFAFDKNPYLVTFDSGSTVQTIESDSFCQLPALRNVILRAPVVNLGAAYMICDNIRDIRIYSSTPTECTSGSRDPFGLNVAAEANLYVPDGAVFAYRQDMYWSYFTNILPMSQAPELETPVREVPVAHAYQMGSSANVWGFAEWPVNDIAAKTIVKSTSSTSDQVGAGEYVDGKYYTYTVTFDMLMGNGLEPSEFVVYNADDFSVISSHPAWDMGRVVDMAYDYTHNTMYALVEENRTSNNAIGLTALNVVDMNTGEVTLVGLPGDIRALDGYGRDVEEHLVALASDPADGQLYAMGEYRQLYKLDRMTGLATAVGARNRVAITNDFQSMAFDAESNLYQVQMHPDHEYWMQISTQTGALTNPVTGEAVVVNSDFSNNAARFAEDPQFTGLYFEGKTYVSNVPAAVTGLSATLAPGEPNTAVLTWTAPTAMQDGSALQMNAYRIYRMGTATPLATISTSNTTYTDRNAPNGEVSYYVVPLNGSQAGFPAWTTLTAGYDVLEAVRDLEATIDGHDVTVTWQAPAGTVNGGYADYETITYNVIRHFGSETTTLATDLTATNFTTTVEQDGSYTFEVIPFCGGVQGLSATSNEVSLLEGIATLPYTTGFEDTDDGTLWTVINNTPNNGYGWSVVTGYAYQQLSGKFAQFKTYGSSAIPANDWFISPPIEMPAGDFELSYYANGASYDNHTYKVFEGPDSTDPTDFTNCIYSLVDQKVYSESDENKHFVLVTIPFSLEQAGVHRIAFQGIGASTYATLKIDNLQLICTREVGVTDTTADTLSYNAATRTVSCPAAQLIEAYDMNGVRIAAATAQTLTLPATGVTIVRAVTPGGVMTLKLNVR